MGKRENLTLFGKFIIFVLESHRNSTAGIPAGMTGLKL